MNTSAVKMTIETTSFVAQRNGGALKQTGSYRKTSGIDTHDFVSVSLPGNFSANHERSRVYDVPYARVEGILTSIFVPESGPLDTVSLPPSNSARSCIPRRP